MDPGEIIVEVAKKAIQQTVTDPLHRVNLIYLLSWVYHKRNTENLLGSADNSKRLPFQTAR
jgi:hypothetical protein